MQSSWRMAVPWPLYFIDFEASSLDQDSYPIEVGLAVWPGPDEAVHGWSTLIRPTGEWIRRGRWSTKSAKLHGISAPDLLANGQPVRRVAETLNDTRGVGTTAWCHGGDYDAYWMAALFEAAAIDPVFVLADWPALVRKLDPAIRDRALASSDHAPRRHRARKDAERLALSLAEAAMIDLGLPQDLALLQLTLAPPATPVGPR